MDFSKIIFVTDLDGTLLTDDKRVLQKDLDAINRFRAGGGLFAAATGRGYSMAKRVVELLGCDIPSVVFNGAAVFDFKADKFLWQCEIGAQAREYIRKITKIFPRVGVEVLCAETVYVPLMNDFEQEHLDMENVVPVICSLDEIPENGWLKFLFTGEPDVLDEIEKITSSEEYSGAHWVRSAPVFYECLPVGVDKSRGFSELIKILGAEDRFSVAAGDYKNDAAMIKKADLGVAVGNALDEVKAVADIVVCDNNSGIAAEIIDHLEKL